MGTGPLCRSFPTARGQGHGGRGAGGCHSSPRRSVMPKDTNAMRGSHHHWGPGFLKDTGALVNLTSKTSARSLQASPAGGRSHHRSEAPGHLRPEQRPVCLHSRQDRVSLRPRSRPETRPGGRACPSDQARGLPWVGAASVSNGCWDSALTPSCHAWQKQRSERPGGGATWERLPRICGREGSNRKPTPACNSLAVEIPNAEPVEGRTGAGCCAQASPRRGGASAGL